MSWDIHVSFCSGFRDGILCVHGTIVDHGHLGRNIDSTIRNPVIALVDGSKPIPGTVPVLKEQVRRRDIGIAKRNTKAALNNTELWLPEHKSGTPELLQVVFVAVSFRKTRKTIKATLESTVIAREQSEMALLRDNVLGNKVWSHKRIGHERLGVEIARLGTWDNSRNGIRVIRKDVRADVARSSIAAKFEEENGDTKLEIIGIPETSGLRHLVNINNTGTRISSQRRSVGPNMATQVDCLPHAEPVVPDIASVRGETATGNCKGRLHGGNVVDTDGGIGEFAGAASITSEGPSSSSSEYSSFARVSAALCKAEAAFAKTLTTS